MPNIDFIVDDGEFAYEGVANYSVRKGCNGDNETPGVADAVDSVTIMRVEASGVLGKRLLNVKSPSENGYLRSRIKASRLLMERLEELCEADLARGSDE